MKALEAVRALLNNKTESVQVPVQTVPTRERMQICSECDKVEKQYSVMKCSVCKCWCTFKTAIPAESCPLGKW